jgi:hypothetical protein
LEDEPEYTGCISSIIPDFQGNSKDAVVDCVAGNLVKMPVFHGGKRYNLVVLVGRTMFFSKLPSQRALTSSLLQFFCD